MEPVERIYNKGESLHFIINPMAGNGRALVFWNKMEGELRKRGIVFTRYFTEGPGHARQIAAEICMAANGRIIIAAVGGDGTIHEVVNGTEGFSDVRVAAAAAGSANDFARGFSAPSTLQETLKLFIHPDPPVRAVDLAECTSGGIRTLFVNSAGIGIDAETALEAGRSRLKKVFNKLRLGGLVYILIFLKKLFTYERPEMTVQVDEASYTYTNVWFIAAANQPYFGGGIKIAPHAVPDDGELNMIIVHTISPIKLLFVFLSVYWGGHLGIKNVESLTFTDAMITADSNTAVQADGEWAGSGSCRVSISKKKLTIIPRIG
ncbi:diacylglycerol/lipid kinase family protein [Peribacillus sp. SCS-37]|uniref:diacylglycerol/lipid kinase family protein n=1 Tax=Paraperibacillus esterisolvens TaxID=3115296 RepID=UPI003905E96C